VVVSRRTLGLGPGADRWEPTADGVHVAARLLIPHRKLGRVQAAKKGLGAINGRVVDGELAAVSGCPLASCQNGQPLSFRRHPSGSTMTRVKLVLVLEA
jgi:hypothetical protein